MADRSRWSGYENQIKYNFNDYYVNDDEKTLFALVFLSSRFVSLLRLLMFYSPFFRLFDQFPFLFTFFLLHLHLPSFVIIKLRL